MSLHILYLAVVWSLHLLVQLSLPLILGYGVNMTSGFFSSTALLDACEQVTLLLFFCLLFYGECTKPDNICTRNYKNYSEYISAITGPLIVSLKQGQSRCQPSFPIHQARHIKVEPATVKICVCFVFLWSTVTLHMTERLPVPHHGLWLAGNGEEPCVTENLVSYSAPYLCAYVRMWWSCTYRVQDCEAWAAFLMWIFALDILLHFSVSVIDVFQGISKHHVDLMPISTWK